MPQSAMPETGDLTRVPKDRPLLAFDGDCNFCRHWIRRWQQFTGDRVEYSEYQNLGDRVPDIPRQDFAIAVQWIEPGRKVLSGADAVFRLYDFADRTPPWFAQLRRVPGFLPVSRLVYRFISRNRTFFSWLWGTLPKD